MSTDTQAASDHRRFARIRLYESVRTAHLERAREVASATIVYRVKRYDFDESLAEGLDLVQAGPLGTALLLARHGADVVEVNEPLMTSSLPSTALALLGLGLNRLATRRRASVVTYAIENDDPFARARPARLRGRVRRGVERRLASLVWRRLDRVAYGTAGAEAAYRARLGAPSDGRSEALIPALPAASVDRPSSPETGTALFVGALVERKGVRILLSAWPRVTARLPGARLAIIGTGALEAEVARAVEADPTISLTIDPPREVIHQAYESAAVVTLPSQRSPRWREQVGLPIVEALSHGCHVVTTDQTGLAEWLASNGHTISVDSASPEALADALVAALHAPLDRGAVLAGLPARDGRLAADDWLFA